MGLRLSDVPPAEHIDDDDYAAALSALQRRLAHLRLTTAGLLEARPAGPAITLVFEGFDAAGKGGAIRRLSEALDPRLVRVVPISAPTAHELAHHFLWRFQHALPARGEMTIFDRSWYGRVLVERVEKLITPHVVERSAKEIAHFEQGLIDDGQILIKLWLNVSPDVQRERFEERAADPLKQWKLTDEDWRNRSHRDEYEAAVNDMLAETHRDDAPWHLINGDHKKAARLAVLRTVIHELERGLRRNNLPVPDSRGDDYLESDS